MGVTMRTSEFDYHLPEPLIAQMPLPERDASRLLVLRRESGAVLHRRFRDLGTFLRPGDLVVLNDTKVIPARLYGQRPGGGRVEILLVHEESRNHWWVLVRPARRLPVGRHVSFRGGLSGHVVDRGEEGMRLLRFDGIEDIRDILPRVGMMPLPPYIKRGAVSSEQEVQERRLDAERYQTVYAREAGAIAAPTAGFHFTEAVLRELERQGVEISFLTLHVGTATFKPVTVERVDEHRMGSERYTIPESTAAAVKRARADGRRVVAVGSTTTRALEDAALYDGEVRAGDREASLFITPGHHFQVVDGLVTNFHLPRSTLLMLVSAFAGRDMIVEAYADAVRDGYRFYSYGDAMLIL
ncbi:MAG: tRNA preQ1(34) S-adenosylmethionine ribosyltransferase-isomerase QueA [Candidatus Methylomirabilales bacterium]